MLVSELKTEIEKYDKKELKSIIVELYKRIPKNKKEEYNVDDFIKDINNNNNNKTSNKTMDFETLQKEIIYFIQCVDSELYAVPNKIISKKERSGWRFKVKRYYKELNNILPNSEYGGIATILLIEIFKRLSTGSNTLLFINWDTFKALGVSQSDYYDSLMKRMLYNGYTKENLEKCVDLLDVPKDPCELSFDMFCVFLSNLKTFDTKEMSIDLLKVKIDNLNQKLKNAKGSYNNYYIEENINNCVECILKIYITLNEYEAGIKFFHKNYIETRKEVKEYILLEILEDYELTNEWIKEYESNMNKVDFRESLIERYNSLKNS